MASVITCMLAIEYSLLSHNILLLILYSICNHIGILARFISNSEVLIFESSCTVFVSNYTFPPLLRFAEYGI